MSKNARIKFLHPLRTPQDILHELPLTSEKEELVVSTRKEIQNILEHKSNKIFIIVGPCSIHDPKSALEYAKFLRGQIDKYRDKLVIVMRTYFSKPRTIGGWKGYINDPKLDNTYDINYGLFSARKLLLDILELGVPCSMEQLDTIIPQYFNDLLSWSAIGARTTESQVHRELASGISTPIGFKNSTDGNIDVAINAIKCSALEHFFMGCNMEGNISAIQTLGNPYGHIILRGSNHGPNYDSEYILDTEQKLAVKNLPINIVVDASHGNSNKDFRNQYAVVENICQQINKGNKSVKGLMIESNIIEGKQNINDNPLIYGKSVTDGCVNLETTEKILEKLFLTKE